MNFQILYLKELMTNLNLKKSFLFTVIGLLFFTSVGFAQYDIPEKPSSTSKQTSLYDYIGMLSSSEKNALEQKLIRYSDSTSTQIVLVIINSTKGEDISFLGTKWGQKWGVGQDGKDNGILILLAKGDRMIDINTGYGIESIISDRDAKQIIERIIIPQFKQDNYYGGLDKGTDAVFKMLIGKFDESRDFSKETSIFSYLPFIFFILFFILMFFKNKGGKGGRGGGGVNLLDVIILSSMGRSGGFGGGGGSFGGSSGGFGGGFGGGGFGGGGASGGW
ncbi:MAG: TPM domain-containing protein [Flavobacteriaceae bacterium]|nr:TPM domain-containing protein [Flavobacteriaceae bacterium]